ncbi:MAG: 4-(cytidine 5'-diphospho)-2-C-methyl-D-erythritol kinase [Desulfocapsaceae bacterium]
MKIELPAPAKVNLYLHVTGRREDGYHELITRMQKLDFCDQVTLELNDSGIIEIDCDNDHIGADQSNLAVRAAQNFFLAHDQGGRHGLKIKLEKRIPIAAGLGGGSSDGAAVLRGLNELFGFPFSERQLIDCGRGLGADFAFFISSHEAAVATGIGDKLDKVDAVGQYHYLLVNPGIHVETRWVYDNYRLTKNGDNFIFPGSLNSDDQEFTPADLHNDLEAVTVGRHPVIAQVKELLIVAGAAGALMSGSGPTVFGLFEDEKSAETAAHSLTRKVVNEAGWRIISAKTFDGA